MKKYQYKPLGWQLDSSKLDSDKIQLWKNGIMLTLIDKIDAVKLIDNKDAFVISSQAIGYMRDGISEA